MDLHRVNFHKKSDRPKRNSSRDRPRDDRFSRDRPRDDRFSRDRPRDDRFSRDRPRDDRFSRDRPRDDRFSRDRPRDDRFSRDRPRDDRFSRDRPRDETHEKHSIHENKKKFTDRFKRSSEEGIYLRENRPSKNEKYARGNRQNYHSKEERDSSRNNKKDYFSDGSDAFYETLREKLFEILGGKKCVNCGFSDARALGFDHISDESTFDLIRRGGSASSWGKYISNPDVAKEELRVLCLNCNSTQPKKQVSIPKKGKFHFKL